MDFIKPIFNFDQQVVDSCTVTTNASSNNDSKNCKSKTELTELKTMRFKNQIKNLTKLKRELALEKQKLIKEVEAAEQSLTC